MSEENTASNQPLTPQEALRVVLKKWVALRGHPALLFQSGMIGARSMLLVQKVLRGKGFPKLDVFLDSPGGSPDHAFRVATLIHDHAKEVTGVVPHYAKSACTLIALGMDELILGELGELGPLDTQRYVKSDKDEPKPQSSLEVVKAMEESKREALNLWRASARMLIDTENLTVSGAYELAATFVGKIADTHYSKIQLDQYGESVRALDIGKKYAQCVLQRYANITEAKARMIAKRFVESYPSHGYAIDLPELKAIGLKARGATSEEAILLDEAQQILDYLLQCVRSLWDHEIIELFEPQPAPLPEPKGGGQPADTALVQNPDPNGPSDEHNLTHAGTKPGKVRSRPTVPANGKTK